MTDSSFFSNKRILVFGLGILGGGVGVVKTLLALGAVVRITDMKTEDQLSDALKQIERDNIDKLTLGSHDVADIEWAEIIIKNPAVPSSLEQIQQAMKQGKHVTTEAGLFLKLTQSQTIGITGTRGKTTTTMMIYEMMKKAFGDRVQLGGNIQDTACLSLLLTESTESISILELSSWALEGCHSEQVSPDVAVITNLYPDHLNRYAGEMEKYAHDKAAITHYQKSEDHCYLNAKNEWTPYFIEKSDAQVHLVDENSIPSSWQLAIPGEHNRWNASFAYRIGLLFQIDPEVIKESITTFTGVDFRQQVVGKTEALTFINDSTSTTPIALEVALQTFPDATFIIGGTSKDLPFDSLLEKLQAHDGNLIFLKGTGTSQLLEKLQSTPHVHESLKSAFEQAVEVTSKGTIVFSPGFTSFELFKNEFDRAEQFNTLVNEFLHSKS